MGDPKKIRRKYSTPAHPWQKSRIEEEAQLTDKYALKNKKEIWKMVSILKEYKKQAKKLSSATNEQAEKEKKLLVSKLISMGLLKEGDGLEAVLILKNEDIMERRLQTVVVKNGYARTMRQARQFITHGHVKVDGKVITSPSFVVLVKNEGKIEFKEQSSLKDPEHPERKVVAKPVEKAEENPEAKEEGSKKKGKKEKSE